MELIFTLVVSMYACLLIVFSITWSRKKLYQAGEERPSTKISVLIAARNEEQNIGNILSDLARQDYPAGLFEVLVTDDSSEDATAEIVNSFPLKKEISLKLLKLIGGEGKKAALRKAIEVAEGKLIVTTDADCRVGEYWLKTIESFYRHNELKMITGPVAFNPGKNFFEKMQVIEFASLIGTGAVTLDLGIPSMCNGANLAYEKSVFMEVNGFSGNEQIASGDDEFLMHKVAAAYPGKVAFLKSAGAIVTTSQHVTWSGFFNQRKRWASKWNFYNSFKLQLLAVFIFLQNFIWVCMLGYCLFKPLSFFVIFPVLILKVVTEFVFLRQMVTFLRNKVELPVFLLLQFIYPFYVSFFGLISKSGKYRWKGRHLK